MKKGDLGGWIEKEKNLSREDNCWVYGNAWVYGDARVSGDAKVCGNAMVFDDAKVFGDARVCGDARVSGNTWTKTPLHIHGTRHCLTNSKHGHITIGCRTETIEWWLSEEAEKFAKENGYSYGDIQEYKEYILLIKKVGF